MLRPCADLLRNVSLTAVERLAKRSLLNYARKSAYEFPQLSSLMLLNGNRKNFRRPVAKFSSASESSAQKSETEEANGPNAGQESYTTISNRTLFVSQSQTKDISSMRFHTSSKFRSNTPITYCDTMRGKGEAVVELFESTLSNVGAGQDGLRSTMEELNKKIHGMGTDIRLKLNDKIHETSNDIRSTMEANHKDLNKKIHEMGSDIRLELNDKIHETSNDIRSTMEANHRDLLVKIHETLEQNRKDQDTKQNVILGFVFSLLLSILGVMGWVMRELLSSLHRKK